MNKSLSISALATTFAILLGASQAHASSRTWVGSTSTDWAGVNGFNTTPVTGDSLVFGAAGAAGTALTNTLTTSAFNIAGITFNVGAPAYTMTGNSFNLTAGMTNNSGVLQTFNNTGVVPVSGSTGGTVLNAAGLTLSGGTTWNVGTAGITVSGLQFNTTSNSSSTTTVNGSGGTLTIGYLGLGTMSTSRLVQTFNGSGNISVGTIAAGGSASPTTDSFTYSGTGTFSLTGSHTDTFGDTINSGTFILSGTLGAPLSISGTANMTETSAGVINGGSFALNSSGTATLAGANTYAGATTVNAGTLVLDHSVAGAPATNIINNTSTTGSGLTLGGGTLSIKGNASATNSDRFYGTTLTTLTSSKIGFTQNGAISLSATLGGLTRGAQSVLDITLPTAGTVSTTSNTFATNGVLTSAATNGVAFATVNGGAAFASNSTGTISAITPATGSAYGATANVSVGTADAPTSGAGANTLTFNGASDTVTFTGTNAITTGGILASSSATGTSTITGGTITAGGGKELTIFNYEPTGSGSLTVASVIADNITASALTIAGAGTTVLSGANTFTGQTALLGGTLDLANQLALQNSTLQLNTGASLVFDQSVTGNAFTLGGLSSSVNISLLNNAGTPAAVALTVGGNGSTTTYTGVLSGTGGSLTKVGTGTLVLNGVNTYTGATTVNAGSLNLNGSILNSAISVGASGNILFTSNNNESAYVTGGIAGQGGIGFNFNNPSNVYSLNEANTYTGATNFITRGVVQAGVATVYSGSVPTSGAFGVDSALTFTASPAANPGGETVILKGFNQQVGSLVGGEVGNGIVLNGANLTVGGDNTNATFGGQITGGLIPNGATATHYNALGSGANIGGNLIKIGTGTQSLTGSNFYTGSTLVDGGTLSVDSIANGGFATTLTSGIATGATTLNVTSAAGVVAGQTIVGSGGLQNQTVSSVAGNTITFSPALPDQAVSSGTAIYFGTGNSLGISTNAASNLVLDGGTLQYTGAATSTDRLFTVGSNEAGGVTGTLDASGTGALTFSNTGSIAYGTTNQTRTLGLTGSNTGANTLAPLIADNGSGAVSVLKSGAGSWTLTNANTYSGGTTVTAGILNSAVAGGFGAGNVTVAPTGTTSAGSTTLNSTGSIASTALVTVNNNGAAIGTVNFNGATPSIGGLSGNGNAVLNSATGTVLTVGANNSSSAFNGVISERTVGMGSLTKEGTGTLRLNGANTYTGSTTVNAGTLIVGGSTAAGSAVTINNGGTLGGTGSANEGTLNGIVTVASGTTGSINLQDGAIGTLSVGGLTVNGGKLSFDLGGGLTSDSIASAGALTINGATTINLGYVSGTPSLSNGTYSLITYNNGGGALGSTAFGNLTLNTSALTGTNQTFTLVNNAGNLEVNVASSYTKTTYTLTTSAASTLLHAGGSTALTTTLTNTGSGTDDSLAYSGVGASTASGTVAGATINSPPTVPNGNNSVSNTNQTFSTAVGSSGTATISSTGTVTDSHLADTPTGTSTGTSITVYSGFGTWITNGSGTWGTAPTAVPVNWSAAGGTPGVTAGFTGVDTATFGAQTATAITVGLNGAAPNLNAITFSSPDTAYTLAQNYAGGTGTSSITLSGTTPSINVTNPGSSLTAGTQTISAPLILGATTSLNVAANQKLNISGQISSAGTFGLTNSGPGTTTLTSDTGNTYTGPTTITGGTVFIKNTSGSATGTGAVTVSGSSTVLKGHGEIDGAVTLSGGATLFSGSTSAGTGPGTGMKLTSALAVNGAALTFQLSNGTNSATYANPNTTTSYLDLGTTGTVSFSGMDTINLVDLSNGGLTLRLRSPYLLISGNSSSVFYGLVIRTSSGAIGLSQNGFQGSVLGVWTGTGDDYKEFTFNQYGSDGITPLAPTDAGNTTGAYISPFLYLSGGNLEVVPEPGTWALMIGGLALLIVIQRRKHRSN